VKGLLTGLLGMFLATVGLDPITGAPRFTFDTVVLTGGIEFIAVMIGLFGVAEGLKRYAGGIDRENFDRSVARVTPTVGAVKNIAPTSVASGIAGALIGAIPGAGGDIASFVTYNEAKRWVSDAKPEFGEGNPLGVAAAESGNNSSTGGALIPTLTLGIPGDSVTAILIGALMVHGIRPGPGLLQEEPALVYAIFAGFFLVYVLILVFGLLGAHLWVRLIDFPAKYLWPAILVLCAVGALALRGNLIDVWVMLGAGVLGLFLRADNYPLAPMVLGMILGPIAESNLRRSLTLSDGSLDIFLQSPIALAILGLTAISMLLPVARAYIDRSPLSN
jgi:putative tricarboxylic transport membrane protein